MKGKGGLDGGGREEGGIGGEKGVLAFLQWWKRVFGRDRQITKAFRGGKGRVAIGKEVSVPKRKIKGLPL